MTKKNEGGAIQKSTFYACCVAGVAGGICVVLIVILLCKSGSDAGHKVHGYTAVIPSPLELKDEPRSLRMKELTELDQLRNQVIYQLRNEYQQGKTLQVWLADRQHQNNKLVAAIQKELKDSGWQGPLAVAPQGWYFAIRPQTSGQNLAQTFSGSLKNLPPQKRAEAKLKFAHEAIEEVRDSGYVIYIPVDFYLELAGKLAAADRAMLSADYGEVEAVAEEVVAAVKQYRDRCDNYESLVADVRKARRNLSETVDNLVPVKYEATRLANAIRKWQKEPAPDPEVRKHLGKMEYLAHIYAVYALKGEYNRYLRGLETDRTELEEAIERIEKGKFEEDLNVAQDKHLLWSKVDDTLSRMKSGIGEVTAALQVVQPFLDDVNNALDEADISRNYPHAKGERLEIERAIARKFFESANPEE